MSVGRPRDIPSDTPAKRAAAACLISDGVDEREYAALYGVRAREVRRWIRRLRDPKYDASELAYARSRYKRLRRKRLCVYCARPTSGFVLCEHCRAQSGAVQASRYHEKKQRGACIDCASMPSGAGRCTACSARRRALPSRQWSYRKKLERPGTRRRTDQYTCGNCGGLGHNRRSCSKGAQT